MLIIYLLLLGTVVQEYIVNPFLIDGLKCDLRLYVLITSCDPLQLYLYHDGLVRMCTHQYSPPTESNMQDQFMHLTNYTVNKTSPEFGTSMRVVDLTCSATCAENVGNKRTLQWLLSYHVTFSLLTFSYT